MKRSSVMIFTAMIAGWGTVSALAAEHVHQGTKPRHGGVVEVHDVEYELVRRDSALKIYVSDHGKPIPTKGWNGTIATMGGDKLSAELVPSAEKMLEVKGDIKLPQGARLLATIQAPGKYRCSFGS